MGNLKLFKIYDFLSEVEKLANDKVARDNIDFNSKYLDLKKMLNSVELKSV